MSDSKLKIVAVGLYVPGTGFTRVLTSLFDRLCKNYEIHWLGIGYKGAEIKSRGYTIYPTNVEGGDLYGAYQMEEMVNQLDADIVFFLNDFWMFKNYEYVLKAMAKKPITMAYIPLDGNIDNPEDVKSTLFLDYVVCYNNFALEQTENAYKTFIEVDHKPECISIAHGTDLKEFYPLNHRGTTNLLDRRSIKKTVFPNINHDSEPFVILNANRFVERKAIHKTISGFAEFAKNKPDSFLCLHVPNTPTILMDELQQHILESGVAHKIILNPIGDSYVSNTELNQLYNACDVGVNTSMGEGWGMVSFEHAATGAAQIVPKHTACEVLWNDHAELLDIEKWRVLETNPFTMGEVKISSLTQVLQRFYDDRKYLLKLSELAITNASDGRFNWDMISRHWSRIFTEACKLKLIS